MGFVILHILNNWAFSADSNAGKVPFEGLIFFTNTKLNINGNGMPVMC